MMETIGKRKHSEYSMQAALHGLKVQPMTSTSAEPVQMSPEEEAMAMASLESAKKRISERYGR